jgi:tape measure domain-containing protein
VAVVAEKSLRYNVEINSTQALTELDDLWQRAQNGSLQAAKVINERLGGNVKTILDWEVRVDANGVKRLQPVVKEVYNEYEKLNNAQKKFNKTQEGSVTSLRQQLNTATQLRDGLQRIVPITDKYGRTLNGINPLWREQNDLVQSLNVKLAEANGNFLQISKAKFPQIGQALSIGNAISQAVQVAQAVVISFQAIAGAADQLVQREKQIQGLSLALKGFGASASEVAGVLSSAKGISLQYGASLTQIEQSYKRITPAILASGGTLGETEKIIESLAARTTQLGLNTEQSGRYIEAFAQVMGKGKLQSEELNQQFSELDGALRSQIASYLANTHNITDLNDAMKKGEVTAALFREAFVAVSQSARDQLAGAIGEVQQRIDKLNIQQIDNVKNTLNTISLESLNKTFAGFGMAMQRIGAAVSQFFASITSGLPNIQDGFKKLFDLVGVVLEVLVVGFLNGIKVILVVVDAILGLQKAIMNFIQSVPGAKAVLESFTGAGTFLINSFRQGTDAILALGAGVQASTGKLSTAKSTMEQLTAAYKAGAIGVDEYKTKLEQLRPELETQRTAAEEAFKVQSEQLKALKDEIADRYDSENAKIEEQVQIKKDALQQEKDSLSSQLETVKSAYETRKQLIEDETARVKERYAAELDAINAQTPAQLEQVRLRKEKLAATVASTSASYEEKIAAQAQLDTMLQQEKSTAVRAKQEQELKALAAEKAAAERKFQEEKKALEEQSIARQNKLEEAIKALTTELGNNKSAQAKINEEIDATLKLNDTQIKKLSDIPKLVNNQLQQVNATKVAYNNATAAVAEMASQIERAARAQQSLNAARGGAPAPNRFAGGSVAGGQKYTVNEFGREGFLSASGQLSEIKAPAWGQWRAPSTGTIIPAGVFAAMKATEGASSSSRASMVASRVDAGGSIAGLLRGLVGGSRDNITNNVSIQAANTTQAASDILVELTKLKRHRYS